MRFLRHARPGGGQFVNRGCAALYLIQRLCVVFGADTRRVSLRLEAAHGLRRYADIVGGLAQLLAAFGHFGEGFANFPNCDADECNGDGYEREAARHCFYGFLIFLADFVRNIDSVSLDFRVRPFRGGGDTAKGLFRLAGVVGGLKSEFSLRHWLGS